jgi:hypothetical protein
MNIRTALLLASLLALPTTAPANDTFFGAGVGTLGFGLEVGRHISERVALRGGVNFGSYSQTRTRSDIRYDSDLSLSTFSLLADWHPQGEGFRLTGGALINNNKFDKDARLEGAVTIGGTTYQPDEVGSLSGRVDFEGVAPYLGIGWSRARAAASGLSFSADLGALYQGSPRVRLRGTCNVSPVCDNFEQELRAEERSLSDELSGYRWWPVVSLGVRYRF